LQDFGAAGRLRVAWSIPVRLPGLGFLGALRGMLLSRTFIIRDELGFG
jgi:hypothetical protein